MEAVQPAAGRQARSYQQEMFERSMERNTIVVMDTGSGKTHVAVMRIEAELDRCPTEKRVWFLAPSVELCKQQHTELSRALPAYQHRLLVGEDNVDRWSEQRIWDAALDGHRVVVSTHKVLEDALSHGFVQLSQLSLLIFDEAHYCTGKHSANMIMRNFYHPTKAMSGPSGVPHILGLTASLIMKSNLQSMGEIEASLDSISVTPHIHRQELLRFVHRPECQLITFGSVDDQTQVSNCASLKVLQQLKSTLETQQGVQQLGLEVNGFSGSGEDGDRANWRMLKEVKDSIKALCRKAEVMCENLGSWATNYLISQTIRLLEKAVQGEQIFFEASDASKRALLRLFEQTELASLSENHSEPAKSNTSSKVQKLISYLLEDGHDTLVGIIFVQERATTSALTALLNRHSDTKDKFRCGSFVGTSNYAGRKVKLPEIVDFKGQKDTLQMFRRGEYDLLVATNVLEEGIDVQTCNVVACFDPPANVKSFIQRRGRARHIRSRLSIFVPPSDNGSMLKRWQSIEDDLARICQSEEERRLDMLAEEEQHETVDYVLLSPLTGAKLTADGTLPHLYHFCNKLPHQPFVDYSPCFFFEKEAGGIRASVVLPNCLSPDVRRGCSRQCWATERAAKKDAAFHAYEALHKAGLLNDNLLPFGNEESLEVEDDIDGLGLTSKIEPQISLWSEKQSSGWHETSISVLPPANMGERGIRLTLTTPQPLSAIPSLSLHWSAGHVFKVNFGPSTVSQQLSHDEIETLRESTRMLYLAVRSPRFVSCRTDFTTLFAPAFDQNELRQWLLTNSQVRKASDMFDSSPQSLIRVPFTNHPPHLFRGWLTELEGNFVQTERLPKRRNFRSPITAEASEHPSENARLDKHLVESCAFDGPPLEFSRIGLFMTDILQHIEDCTIAARLQRSILETVPFKNITLILNAICASSAMRHFNYQRLEFLGDSFLKFVSSCHLFASHTHWHEHLLTLKRGQMVSNESLAAAATRSGLVPYIITDMVPYKDWTLPTFSAASEITEKRSVSYKTLADVVEALIGAAWIDSGRAAARQCINIFLPDLPAEVTLFNATNIVENQSGTSSEFNFGTADEIESLIGYRFNNRAILLEALTHPSCGGFSQTDSYQRLEYLGDAVLDLLIVRVLSKHIDKLSQNQMHLMKAALVNGRLLGFLCLGLRHCRVHRAVTTDSDLTTSETTSTREFHIASYMRARSVDLRLAQTSTEDRFLDQRLEIYSQLESGTRYPWMELLHLRPEKFFCDIIESIIGAIFVDSRGNTAPCEDFIAKLGLRKYLDRLISETVDVRHPVNRLHRFVGSRSVAYPVRRDESNGKYGCRFVLDEVEVAEVDGCWDREEAMTAVACMVEQMLASGSLT